MQKTREKALLDPRRALALEYYSDATSETFGNATRSLERAGFKPSYARNASDIEWLTAHRASFHVDLIKKAEKNLDRIASINVKLDSKLNVEIAKLQADVSKFIVDRLARGAYGKNDEQKLPEITIQIVSPKAPSATRDAQLVEPKELEQGDAHSE